MSLVEIFLARGQQQSNSLALRVLAGTQDPPQDYTWGQLTAIVAQVAGGLQASLAEPSLEASQEASQVRDPDALQSQLVPPLHVATWLPNGLPWIVVDLATQLLHWVHVALDRRLSSHATMQLATHSRSRVLIVPDAETANQLGIESGQGPLLVNFAELLQSTCTPYSLDRWPMPLDDQPAQILYTSGTMSQPKGVVLTYGNLTSNARAKLDAAPQMASDIRLNILPFAHAYARTCELSTWIISGSQLCIVNDWNELLHWAPVIRPTLINLVPHLAHKLAGLLANDATSGAHILGDRLRLLQVGGAALPLDVWNRLAKVGWAPLQGYGLTETSPVICSNRAGSQRPDSVGYPVPGVDLRIDEQGILWTRGPQVMQGYWQEPRLTADKIVDGWFRTDDLAEMADDGSL
ncbi:MAG: long-chain fatty acid--CoA ligase, partial [Pirellulaceae bacterium]|nr:long-chain fatty acid--CoA ligase [Pirellulaceae bacterium]